MSTRRTALALFLLALVVYSFPVLFDLAYKPFFGYIPGQDVVSTSLLPISLLQRGDFLLDEYRDFFASNWHDPYFVAEVNGHIVSRSTTAAAALALPSYGLPLGSGWLANPPTGWLFFPWSAFFVGKFAAAFMTACAVVMFFFCARELTDLRTSALVTIVFAFATSIWSTASQGLWQQTPSVLFQVIAIWFILRARRLGANALAPAAFFFSAATVSRVNDGLTALLFTVYVLLYYRTAFVRWMLWAIPPVLFFLGYNALYNGSPFVFGYQDGFLQYMVAPRVDAIAGLFLSPSRGLFAYSPFFVFGFLSLWLARTRADKSFYLFSALAILLCVLVLSVWGYWDGGWGYGTRMLTDALPFASLLLIPALESLHGLPHYAFWALVGYAIVVQSFGLWDYGGRWHFHWENFRYDVWALGENEPLFYLKEYLGMLGRFLRVG